MAQARIWVSSYNEKLKKKCPFLQLLLFNSRNELRYCTTKENPEDANHPGLESQRKGVSSRRDATPRIFSWLCFPKSFRRHLNLSMMRTASKLASASPYPLPVRSCRDVKGPPASSSRPNTQRWTMSGIFSPACLHTDQASHHSTLASHPSIASSQLGQLLFLRFVAVQSWCRLQSTATEVLQKDGQNMKMAHGNGPFRSGFLD